MRKFYIYKVTNSINGKIYIGKTGKIRPIMRWNEHLAVARKGPKDKKRFQYLHKAINKYGEANFIFEIIDEFENEKLCFDAEILYISKFNSMNRDIGYNRTIGGDGALGYKHTNETKQKMSEIRSGTHTGANNHFFGKTHTKETKDKISQSHAGKYDGEKNPFFGKTHTPETIKIIAEKNIANNILNPRFGEKAPFFGKKHSAETRIKLSENSTSKPMFNNQQADEIREAYIVEDYNQRELAEQYNTNIKTIRDILKFRGAYKKSE